MNEIEKAFIEADDEVISMVNGRHGPGGELPSRTVTFIPSERAEKLDILDLRIQNLQLILPCICKGSIGMFFIIASALDWIIPPVAVAGFLICFLWALINWFYSGKGKLGNKNGTV